MNNQKLYQRAYDPLSFTAEQKARIAASAAAAASAGKEEPRRKLRLIGKTAVAACLICVLAIGAEAAGIRISVSSILSPIFGGTSAQTEVIDKIGRPINARDTDCGVTIQADAIIGDRYNACIIFSIRRDDGTPLLPEDVTVGQLTIGGFCDIRLQKKGGSHGRSWFVARGNELQYIYSISADMPLNTGSAKAEFQDISYFDGEKISPLVEGNWNLCFDVNFEDSSVYFGEGSKFSQNTMNFTITEASVSPIGIRVAYEVDSQVQWSNAPSGRQPEEDRLQWARYFEDVQILLTKKDGTVLDLSNSGGSVHPEDGKTYCTKSRVFEQIIPLDDVAAIRIGGIDFPIGDIY